MNNEQLAVAEINALADGVWCDESKTGPRWGIFMGSHGGWGETLTAAMLDSLSCCGLGEWWEARNGRLLKEHFQEIADRHLGGISMPAVFVDSDDDDDDDAPEIPSDSQDTTP